MTLEYFKQYIDGNFEIPANTFESVNPATEKTWAIMPAASSTDVDRAVTAAHKALSAQEWRGLTATQRGQLLVRLGDLLERHAEHLARLETLDTGKIIRETLGQVRYMAQYYRYFGGLADKVHGLHIPSDKSDIDITVRREPIGVVAAIVPWNSQFMLSAVKLGPALAAGCTVVLKASEDGPAPLMAFAELIDEAGFPPGVVNIITGFGQDCGKALTSHPLVSRIAFTGGPDTARRIVENSANNLAYTTLELGGKSPILVFDDADLESAANAVVAGIFGASGQSCVAGSRLLIHEKVIDTLLTSLVEKVKKIRIGDPADTATEMGPLATPAQLERIERIVRETTTDGGVILCGGKRVSTMQRGYFYEPTIIRCQTAQSPSMVEELFGPVLSVISFSSEDDAIALANSTQYGLAAGVFTRDIARAHRLIRDLHCGVVWVNTYRAVSPLVPFGGYGLSGLGRESGSESILDYTRVKAAWVKTSENPIPDPFIMR